MAAVWRSCVFTRIILGKVEKILNNSTDFVHLTAPEVFSVAKRGYSNYAHSPFVDRITEKYQYEVVKKPPEWKYVERLLPFETIPKVTPKQSYPSGWVPPREEAKDLPYFIVRTKNHEIPIYLDLTFRGNRKITTVNKIEGDIWLMNEELKSYLKEKEGVYVETRVHELVKSIEVKGDRVSRVREWAYSKGF